MPAPLAVPIVNPNEVHLGGTFFPIRGPVRVTNISVTPNPIIFGDTSRSGDSQVMSQLIQSSNIGGSGIYKANPRTDTERFWTSDLETRFRAILTLPPFVFSMGTPAGVTDDLLLTFEYRSVQYFVFGKNIYSWNDITKTFVSSGAINPWQPTSSAVYKGVAYVGGAYDGVSSGLSYKNGTGSWTADALSTGAEFLAVWDDRLWRLFRTPASELFQVSVALDSPPTAWTPKGQFPVDVVPHGLLPYRDANGSSILVVPTDQGLWAYDAVNQKFVATEIQFPKMNPNDRSKALVWKDGKLYLTNGELGLLAVQSGNPYVVTPMGLDLDDSVPHEDAGYIAALAPEFNWILALVAGTASAFDDNRLSGSGSPLDSAAWPTSTGYTRLRAWGGGWNTLWTSGANVAPGKAMGASAAYGIQRVYWGTNRKVYSMDMHSGVHNPRNNTTRKFQLGPLTHLTSWYDMGTEVQRKLNTRLYVRVTGATGKGVVRAYYATDLDDTTWTPLGVVSTDGLTSFSFNFNQGIQARFFRYKFEIQRNVGVLDRVFYGGGPFEIGPGFPISDQTAHPIVEFWSSEFMRQLPATYGFAFTIDLTQPHRDKTPTQMLRALKQLADPGVTPTLIPFAYQDDSEAGVAQTYLGTVSRMAGQEFTGETDRGEGDYLVSVMVPYLEDAV